MSVGTTIIVLTVLPGVVGGLVRGLVGISKHVGQSKEKFVLSKLLFSLLVAMAVGGVASVLTEGDWRVSLLAGFAGSDLLESLYKSRLFGLFK